MWMLFAISSMVLYAMEELVGKKIVRDNSTSGSWMVFSATSLSILAFGCVLWISGLGESGQSPILILMENPWILLNSVCTRLAMLLVFIAFKYIGVSIEAAISGVSSVVLFLGFVSINIFTGKLEAVKELFIPGRLIPIILIIVLIFLLSKTDEETVGTALKNKKAGIMITGIVLVLLACIFDASDSLIFAYFISEEAIGEIDYFMSASLLNLFYGAFSIIMVVVTRKKTDYTHQFARKNILFLVLVGIFDICSSLTYVIGSGYDAVKFAMLYIAYPIVPLIGAGIFLKERYTAKQYFCIFGIAIASIVFCLMDYV